MYVSYESKRKTLRKMFDQYASSGLDTDAFIDSIINLFTNIEAKVEESVRNESKSSWPDYNQPGQCGLCGSFTCSGNCFK